MWIVNLKLDKHIYYTFSKFWSEILLAHLLILTITRINRLHSSLGDLEQLNSFPTIAVWSAVKFVLQDNPQASYAFLPLITDPDNLDKQQLFRNVDAAEKKYVSNEVHSPLFAVVMRKIGVHKQLECHGFICQTSEDAIVIAATLYKALMAHMKAKEKKPKNKNGLTCMSMTSSIYNEAGPVPVRPPRRKRSSTSSTLSNREDGNLNKARVC